MQSPGIWTKLYQNVKPLSPQILFSRTVIKSRKNRLGITIKPKRPKVEVKRVIDSDLESVAARGFLRSSLGYRPPHNVREQIEDVCAEFPQTRDVAQLDRFQLDDPILRFKLMKSCIANFNHNIPNSQLHSLRTIGDLVNYFSEPVHATTAYEDMAYADLPPNMHVQQEYERFHPATDTRYGGISAFPKSSTIVSGLRYKDKYPGFDSDPPWKDI